jgi:hypothetical protein
MRADPRAANGLRTAVHATALLIPGEAAADRQALTDAYLRAFEPRSQPEADAILAIVDAVWRARRLSATERALRNAAEAHARQLAPRPVAAVANAVTQAELDQRILKHVLDMVTTAYDPETPEVAGRLMKMNAVAVDRVLGGPGSVADLPLEDAVAWVGLAIEAREAEVERARRRLDDVTNIHGEEISGNTALAGLLDDRIGTRLARERAYVERSLQRALDTLQRLRGTGEFRLVIAAEGSFAGPNPLAATVQQISGIIEVEQ